jgi:hypothetical protein
MVGIFDPACKLLPSWTKELYLCGWGGGGGGIELYSRPYSAGVLLSVSRFRTYKIISPPQTKMTSKDIKGLVSLKFLSPCVKVLTLVHSPRCTRRSCTSSCRVTSLATSTSTWTRRSSSSLPEGRVPIVFNLLFV